MSAPNRLVEGGVSPLGIAALRSARSDKPRDHVRRRILLAAGVSTSMLGTASAASAAGALAAKAGMFARLVGSVKWMVLGALGGGATLVAATQLPSSWSPIGEHESGAARRNHPTSVTSKVRAVEVDDASPDPTETAADCASAPEPVPVADNKQFQQASAMPAAQPSSEPELTPTTQSAVAVSSASAPAIATGRGDIAGEIAALEHARSAMRAGDGLGALQALNAYGLRYPTGRLQPEAIALRVESLVRIGDRASAEALGGQFLSAYPRSPLANRVRDALSNGSTRDF